MNEDKPSILSRKQLRRERMEKVMTKVIRVLFYYHNVNEGKQNIFTACLFIGEGGVLLSRGISICSALDIHNKKDGRIRAHGRALRALFKETDCDEINSNFNRVGHSTILWPLLETKSFFPSKAMYLPKPTEFESELITKCIYGEKS